MNEANQAFYESMLEMNEMLHSIGRIDEAKYSRVKNIGMAALTSQTDKSSQVDQAIAVENQLSASFHAASEQ